MVKVKNSRPSGPYHNPFSNLNQHGVALLDPDKVRQMCLHSGKSVNSPRLNTMKLCFHNNLHSDAFQSTLCEECCLSL